jgi:hypothetical protein
MKGGIISIVTGWGGNLGTGHIQRMANLVDYLNRNTRYRASIVCSGKPDFFPDSLKRCLLPVINAASACIIRDMRDSAHDEMLDLKKYGRTIAVDDCGPGRDLSDLEIDLLPNLNYSISQKDLFIYGYNFTESMRRLEDKPVDRSIDAALYCGYNPPRETVKAFMSMLPADCSCALLGGSDSTLIRKGVPAKLDKSYAETLLSSRVLVSHFGISLYEGHAAGCRLFSINPTLYHSRLSDIARNDINLTNFGILNDSSPDTARSAIAAALEEKETPDIRPAEVLVTIERGMELFYKKITPLLESR